MPQVRIELERDPEHTPTHVSVWVEFEAKMLRYQLTIQDEGLILETIAGKNGDEDMDTLVQTLYSEHPDMEDENG